MIQYVHGGKSGTLTYPKAFISDNVCPNFIPLSATLSDTQHVIDSITSTKCVFMSKHSNSVWMIVGY